MTGILNSIRDTKVLDVTGPGCGETFEVEFNPAIDVSLYHAIRNDGTKKHGVGAIHTRSERSPKCPYCGNKFWKRWNGADVASLIALKITFKVVSP